MTSIRIALVSALAVGTLIVGGSSAVRPAAPAAVSHTVALGGSAQTASMGPVECCD